MPKKSKNIQKVPFSIDIIIQGMPEISYVLSKEGKLLTWNKNMEIIFGYSKDELQNKFVSEFIHEDDKERIVKRFMEMLSTSNNSERSIEYKIVTKSGEVIPILALRSLIIVDGKDYIMGIAVDISKLKKDKTNLKVYVKEIIHLENQLQDYYSEIEKMNQSEIELKEKLFLNAKSFNRKLINNLPGIFYLYEKIDDNFFLKKWNKNYTYDLGYQDDELLNIQPHKFFIEKEYKKVEEAIAQIFITGSAKVEIYTTHKNGKQIPYFYQGYHFEDKGKSYFMGVGIDISTRYALEEERNLQKIEKLKAKERSDANKRELVVAALQISKTSKIIRSALKQIDDILEKQEESKNNIEIFNDLKTIKNELKSQIIRQNNWEVFRLRFTKVHKNFCNDLKAEHPSITKTELKFCTYLKIQLSSSEISSILNVTKEAIKKTRYRIRKKLELLPNDSLEDYISKY